DRAVERLHGSVSEVGQGVFGYQDVRRQRFFDVAGGGGLGALGLRLFEITRAQGGGVDVRVRARIPLDLERVPAALGRPEVITDYGDARRNFEHGPHTGHGLGRRGIEALHFAAEGGRVRHDRGQHLGQLDVDAELRAAGDLLRRVEAAGRLADDLPIL